MHRAGVAGATVLASVLALAAWQPAATLQTSVVPVISQRTVAAMAQPLLLRPSAAHVTGRPAAASGLGAEAEDLPAGWVVGAPAPSPALRLVSAAAVFLAAIAAFWRRGAPPAVATAEWTLLEVPSLSVACFGASGKKTKRKARVSKSVAKRFRVTANGKLIHRRGGKTHLMQKKSGTHRQRLRARVPVASKLMEANLKLRLAPH
jgi:ribosomal protein L35